MIWKSMIQKNVILKSTEHTNKIYAESRKIYLDGKYAGFNAVKVDGNYYLPFRASVIWAKVRPFSRSDL